MTKQEIDHIIKFRTQAGYIKDMKESKLRESKFKLAANKLK